MTLFLGGCLLLALPLFEAGRIYRAERRYVYPAGAGSLFASLEDLHLSGVTDVRIPDGQGGEIGAWYAAPTTGTVVILAHGTEGDRTGAANEMRAFRERGVGFVSIDFPGHGLSPGRVQWAEPERRALRAAATWALAQPGVDSTRLGIAGFSYGAYIVAQVAADDSRMRRVALVSAPSDADTLAYYENRKWGRIAGWWALVCDRALGLPPDSLKAVRMVGRISPRPLLLVHGSDDPFVPVSMAHELMDAAREPKALHVVAGGGHLRFESAEGKAYLDRLVDFFSRAEGASPALAGAGERGSPPE